MALTINGRRTGRAGAMEKADLRQWLLDEEDKEADRLCGLFVDTRDELKRLDPIGWSQWYDDNVPNWKGWINCEPAIDVMQKRVDELLHVRIVPDTSIPV